MTSSIQISSPADQVWHSWKDPRSTLPTSTNVIKAFHVSDAPAHVVGEQQCIISSEAGRLSAHISEVVALEAPHRMVSRWPTMPTEVLSTLTLVPDRNQTNITYQIGFRVNRGTLKEDIASSAVWFRGAPTAHTRARCVRRWFPSG